MYSAELAVLVAVVIGTAYSQENGCMSPTTNDLESVISAILAVGESGSPPLITLSNFTVVCRAFAQQQDLLRSVSVVVEYTCTGADTCPSGTAVEQIESGCQSGSWSNIVFGSYLGLGTLLKFVLNPLKPLFQLLVRITVPFVCLHDWQLVRVSQLIQ